MRIIVISKQTAPELKKSTISMDSLNESKNNTLLNQLREKSV